MFGNNSAQASNDDPAMLDSVKQLAADPNPAAPATAPPAQTVQPTHPAAPAPVAPAATTPAPAAPVVPPAPTTTAPVAPTAPAVTTPEPVASTPATPAPATPVVSPSTGPADATAATPSTSPTEGVDHQQLAGMKQHALDHLEPLVNHLDQSAEEEFKTTMMMIQSNDNHTLLEKALEAAKRISDDKARAEALLDIINEINYFASQSNTAS